jgi:hypothetical protein
MLYVILRARAPTHGFLVPRAGDSIIAKYLTWNRRKNGVHPDLIARHRWISLDNLVVTLVRIKAANGCE